MDWFVWRILSSPRLHIGPAELEEHMSMNDALDAHMVLDMWDKLEQPDPKPKKR